MSGAGYSGFVLLPKEWERATVAVRGREMIHQDLSSLCASCIMIHHHLYQ